ncbi:MAG TPA: DCC1-like thiol-disulfide oxidoreductase family protein [Kofleriaceae bacterium]|nr:DCC1-like thiol-disulfide oxidoreductase family protein [Kofleriaceae bacterium]
MTPADTEAQAVGSVPPGATLVLYDGVCGLCNGLVTFMLRRDRRDRFRFTSLQGELGRGLVRARGGDPDELSTLYLIERAGQPDERVWRRGRAGLIALASLGRGWILLHALRVLPTALLDLGYRTLASRRYRLGGRLEACPVPAPEHRHKFIG